MRAINIRRFIKFSITRHKERLLALSDIVIYFLTFIERCIARGLEIRLVHEQLFPSIVWSDEAVPFV